MIKWDELKLLFFAPHVWDRFLLIKPTPLYCNNPLCHIKYTDADHGKMYDCPVTFNSPDHKKIRELRYRGITDGT